MSSILSQRPSLLNIPRRTFRSLRHRNYRLYFGGQIVSFTGSWMQSTALMWLVFDRTSNPIWPSLMLVAAVGPTLFLGPLGGALADRLPKRNLVFATQLSFLLHALVMTALIAADFANPWLLFSFQLLSGMVQAIDLPARLAFVPDLIPKEDLINAVGLNSLLFNSARAIGPGLAGLVFLLSAWLTRSGTVLNMSSVSLGAVCCFSMNALSYAAVLIALTQITVGGTSSSHTERGRFWDGIRYLGLQPALAMLLILTGLFSIFSWPMLTLLPAYTRLVLARAETSYSILLTSLGAGALFGALVTATYGTVPRRGAFLLAGVSCGIIGLFGLASVTTLLPATAFCAIVGLGLILYLSTGQSTMQLDVPDHVRGRVMALWAMTLSISAPTGHLLAGFAAQSIPVPQVILGMIGGISITFILLLGLVASGGLKK